MTPAGSRQIVTEFGADVVRITNESPLGGLRMRMEALDWWYDGGKDKHLLT